MENQCGTFWPSMWYRNWYLQTSVLHGWQCLKWYSLQRIIISQGRKERMDCIFSYVCSSRTEFSRVPFPQLVVANCFPSHWLEPISYSFPNWPLVRGILITWLALASSDLCPGPRESLPTSITCDHLGVEQNWGFGGKKKRAGNDVGENNVSLYKNNRTPAFSFLKVGTWTSSRCVERYEHW